MAFDGFVVAALAASLGETLTGGRITKISQPEADELLLTIKNYDTYKLLLSANASLPLVYLTEQGKQAPLAAPNFCMLLRKHLNSARILQISQPGLERVLRFQIEHLDELGDKKIKWLIVEIMGKHSNIIFCDEEMKILDSIKHVSSLVSSVREVLPGRTYFLPQTSEKHDPLALSGGDAASLLAGKPLPLAKAVYTTFTGFSPIMGQELCHRAGLDGDLPAAALTAEAAARLAAAWDDLLSQARQKKFSPCIVKKQGEPVEFAALPLRVYGDYPEYELLSPASVSQMLEQYYRERESLNRMRQRSADLRKIVQTACERTMKKQDLQEKQLRDTEKRESYRLYGELLMTYGYSAAPGSRSLTCTNYYTGEEVTIPLDEALSATENAKRYYERYAKLKRTAEQLAVHLTHSREELSHLASIRESLEYASCEEDLAAIRRELTEFGYLKFHKSISADAKKGRKPAKSAPLHFQTADGYDIYVGKNNYQNDELTFRFANGGDWWFHAKGVPGSHVVLRTQGAEPPVSAFEAAASLAALYSANRQAKKVEIDYLERKNVKKPNGSKPGFVVYYTNYSMMARPTSEGLALLSE